MSGLGARLRSAYGMRKAQTGALYNRKFIATDKTTAEESVWRDWYFPLGLSGETAAISFVGASGSAYAPGLSPGPVVLTSSFVGAASAALDAVVSPGPIMAFADHVGSFGAGAVAPTLHPGAIPVAPSFSDSVAAVFGASLSPGATSVSPSFASVSGDIWAPWLAPGPVAASIGFVPGDAGAFDASVVTHGGTHPGFISAGSLIWAPSLGGDDGAYRVIRIRMRRRRRRR